MWLYVKTSLIECVLCIVASTCLAYTACSGFYATQGYQDATGIALTALICAALTCALFAVAYSRRTVLIGVPILVALVVGALVASVATSLVATPMEDVAGNRLYYALCTIVPCVAVFLLSRKKVGCIVLIVCGVALCAAVEYLYWYGHVASFLLFLVAAATLYVYRGYQASLLASESVRLAFGSITLCALALAGVAVLAGVGLFAGVIAPLGPGNITVKLVTEHYRADELEVRGIGSNDDTLDEDEQTDESNDEVVESSEPDEAAPLEDEGAGENPFDMLSAADDDSLLGRIGSGLASFSLLVPEWGPWALLAVLAALVAASIFLKKLLRRRRFERAWGKGGGEAMRELYLFFLDRFRRFKIPQPGTLTLTEYAAGFSETFRAFEQGAAAPEFARLTDVYVGHVYGDAPVSEADLALFKDYYERFYKRACGYVGRLRYCRMFFRV